MPKTHEPTTTTIPDVLPGHWETPEGAAQALEYADRPRDWLMGSKYTDMQVAHEIAMTGRGDLMFEGKLQMAKHRIRWLSVQLAMANAAKAELLARVERAMAIRHPNSGKWTKAETDRSWEEWDRQASATIKANGGAA